MEEGGRDSNTYMPMDTSRAPIGVMSAKKKIASTHAEWGVETRETVDVQLQRGKRMHNIINQRLEKKIRTPIIVLFARAAEPLAPPENGTPEPFAVPPEVAF